MTAFTWKPAPGATKNLAPRILSVQFGDGYQQHVADGINPAPRSWSLTFQGLRTSVADALEAYLTAAIGSSFDWTDPDGYSGQWMCAAGWQRVRLGPMHATITTTFTQVFGE